MSYTLQHFALIFVVLMVCLSFTFAPLFGPPVDPPPGTVNDCLGWLSWYGFEDTDMENNRKLAQGRNREHDKEVYKYAALYAQLICSFNARDDLLPSDFCSNYAPEDIMPFEKFKTFERYCITWLNNYGFTEGKYLNPDVLHWYRSKNRNKSEDKYINIWPALFVRFLDDVPVDKSMEAKDFCLKMGQKFTMETWTYMTLDTQMSCEDWIKFGGYSNSFQENIEVANQNSGFDQYTNAWAHRYGNHIRVDSADVPLPRKMPGYGDPKYYEYINDNTAWLTPNQFCIKNEKKKTSGGDVMYSYFNDN